MAFLFAKTYRNIGSRVYVLGLGVSDWGILAVVTGVTLVLVDSALVSIAILAGTWTWMYRVKARKPEGFTMDFFSFWASPRSLSAELEIEGREHGRQN